MHKEFTNTVILSIGVNDTQVLNYDAKLKELCKNNKIKYIPMQEVLEKVDFIDGLHPNYKGHKKIFEYVIENIK